MTPFKLNIAMKNITKIVTSALLLCLFFYGATRLFNESHNDLPMLSKEIIKVDGGYGYQIYSGDKLLVQQEFIPAIKGKKPFKTSQDAQKVANLVLEKINAGTKPYIKKEELEQLNVLSLYP
ncbi:MAG: hypothetical protein CMH46_13750 [Muricauda sp.]|nr:hypothetical protein [Allomuricauda sp.]